MQNEIICPKCSNRFTLNEVMSEELNIQLQNERKRLNDEVAKWKKIREQEFEEKLKKEAEEAEKKAAGKLEMQLKALQQEAADKTKLLQDLQKKELELLREKKEMEEREKYFEIEKEKYLIEKRTEIEQMIIRRENEMFELKMKEKDTQMESMRKTIDDLKRKSEQGSMQLQGEVQELLLEQILRENFPFDLITEVGKGVEGADCIQVVRNAAGKECGRIIFESKRTKAWGGTWIEKLKHDMRKQGADLAILVSQVYPKNLTSFGWHDGVLVCNFNEVSGVAGIIRQWLLQMYDIQKREENKGDKMQMLYDYLTGIEFRGHVEAIAEGFRCMRDAITKERVQMEKIWKEREKQLEKVLLNTSGLFGSIKGIAGASVGNIPLLDGEEEQPLVEQ